MDSSQRHLSRLKRITDFLALVLIPLLIAGCSLSRYQRQSSRHIALSAGASPPIATKEAKADTIHDDIRVDNYYWLRDRTDPQTIAYLAAENEYSEQVMHGAGDFQETIYREMIARIQETDLSVPYKLDDYYYYTRTEEGKQYNIYCRKKGTLEASEEILLDQNELAAEHEYFEIGIMRISLDHSLLAFSVDTTGSESYTLYFKDLASGQLLPEQMDNTGYSLAWATDSKTIFYTTLDATKRPFRVHRHEIGTTAHTDEIVYEEKNDAFFAYVYPSKNRKFIFLETGTHTTSEIHYLHADDPAGCFSLVYPRQHEIEYYLESLGDEFLILTNENAKNFKLVTVPITSLVKQNWKTLIPHCDTVYIEGMDVFRNYLAVYEREKGLQKIRIIDRAGDETHHVEFPEPVYSFWMGRNPDFENSALRFTYTSLTTPRSIIDYHMDTREWELKKQYEVLGDYDPSCYASERIFARSDDGTSVPISLVYRRDIRKDGVKPLILYGYGAYGESYDPYFSSNRLSILDRGFIYAIAHVRGGGEMGRDWYNEGRLLNKQHSLRDFIACAEHLITEGYTSEDRLVISGGSAGGLLIGGVLNMRPELFYAAILDVPFLDLLNTMLDPTLPLTTLEYDEWGNPSEKRYYDYMKEYSPYDNVKAQDYPHMLIFASLFDTRVGFWESAKWAAKLRELKTDSNILLLKTQMEAGHMGASGRYDYLRDIAFEYAFLCMLFDITK
jgi:oligopeptidase B